jgi:prepilin-type N-terminal cleavage/methylation domain-containing protein
MGTQYETTTGSFERGFTLVEMLIVIAIVFVLLTATMSLQGNYGVSSQLFSANIQVLQTVRLAREKSIGSLNNSEYGVFFENNVNTNDRVVLYQGTSYALRDPLYDRATVFPKVISLASTFSNNDLNFSKGLGVPNDTGTITITHDAGVSEVLFVDSLGAVSEE